jgi:Spy/CpxP family protein refolding chaperone
MRTATRVAVMAVGAAAIAGSAWAQPLAVPPGRWWERPRIAAELGLSDEQRKTLDAIGLDHARAMVDLKAEVEKSEIDLRAAAEAEPFAAKRIREAFSALQARRSRLEQERFELLLRVREVLTGEQWRKLARLARERLQRRGADDDAPGGGAPPVRQARPF